MICLTNPLFTFTDPVVLVVLALRVFLFFSWRRKTLLDSTEWKHKQRKVREKIEQWWNLRRPDFSFSFQECIVSLLMLVICHRLVRFCVLEKRLSRCSMQTKRCLSKGEGKEGKKSLPNDVYIRFPFLELGREKQHCSLVFCRKPKLDWTKTMWSALRNWRERKSKR